MRICLRDFTPDDFGLLASWFPDERETIRWGGPLVSFPLDDAQMQAMLDQGAGEQPARRCWMAERDGGIIGHVQLVLDWRHGVAELSRVVVAPSVRGQGVAVPMLNRLIDEAFSIASMERVQLNVYAWNAPAIATYRRVGLVTEGIRRAAVRVGAERWDTMIMAMLRQNKAARAIST